MSPPLALASVCVQVVPLRVSPVAQVPAVAGYVCVAVIVQVLGVAALYCGACVPLNTYEHVVVAEVSPPWLLARTRTAPAVPTGAPAGAAPPWHWGASGPGAGNAETPAGVAKAAGGDAEAGGRAGRNGGPPPGKPEWGRGNTPKGGQ